MNKREANRSTFFYNLIMAGWALSTMAWWALAFLPNEQTSPEWVLASRNACFGTLQSGLPNAGGWVLLIGTPITFLIAIFTIWPDEIRKSIRILFSSVSGKLVTISFVSLMIYEAVLVANKIQAGLKVESIDFSSSLQGDLPEHYPRTFKTAPLFKHINQSGEEISLNNLLKKHKTVTLSFAFAQCQTVCPMIVNKLKAAAKKVDSSSTAFVVITLDPWRDTRAAVASWANGLKLPPNAHILTGPVEDIQRTLKSYNVPNKRNLKTGDVEHPPLTYVIDSNAKIAYTLGNTPPEWISQAVNKLIE
ncbi:MAG: SCO family protein [Bacteriovoracaceae bacterium]